MFKLTVYVKPNARSNSIGRDAEGKVWVRIKASPTEGKANKAVAEFLAELLDLPKSKVVLVSGHVSRTKTFSIEGPEPDWNQLVEV